MFDDLADLLLPLRCAACGRPARVGLCARCAGLAARLLLPGYGRTELAEGVEAVGAYAYDGVIREAVVGMKVRGRFAAARPLGSQLRRDLGLSGLPTTWVPTTRARRRSRGFDLPQLLAGPAAQPLLARERQGEDQTRSRRARPPARAGRGLPAPAAGPAGGRARR